MRDYAELVKALRCCSKIDARNNGCDSCSYEYCGEDCQNLCGYAADAIEELLAAVPQWISVEDELPDVAEKVLTYNGDFVSENWLCTVASKVGRVNVWAYSEGFVTHWMPLPESPKEETK